MRLRRPRWLPGTPAERDPKDVEIDEVLALAAKLVADLQANADHATALLHHLEQRGGRYDREPGDTQ